MMIRTYRVRQKKEKSEEVTALKLESDIHPSIEEGRVDRGCRRRCGPSHQIQISFRNIITTTESVRYIHCIVYIATYTISYETTLKTCKKG